MKKLRIYLDTSVISHLDQRDAPALMAETHRLWERIKAGEFEVVISDVDFIEIGKCNESKKNILLDYLKEIEHTLVEVQGNDQAVGIASRIIDIGILRQKSFDDCQHIAAAIISACDVIVSWNFKHIVNIRTIKGVRAITALEGYKDILILDPFTLMGGEIE
jgi:predicted nucleic acid-binding protein